MLYAYKSEYSEAPKDIDEMILGCKAAELRYENLESGQKGGD
ncbi:hypothetical protein [Sporohalobacter salinus]|nr:hypothetical protein [Sporohalobacter salinus]MBM7623647.1 hypothetical protein [Sporohalobacter salinus]